MKPRTGDDASDGNLLLGGLGSMQAGTFSAAFGVGGGAGSARRQARRSVFFSGSGGSNGGSGGGRYERPGRPIPQQER